MSLAAFERLLAQECRTVLKHAKFRKKDLLAWQTTPMDDVREDELQLQLPSKVYVVVPKVCDKRK